MGLALKHTPLRDAPVNVILERTPGEPLLATSLHPQRLILRDETGEKLQVTPLKCLPWSVNMESMENQ